MVETDTEWLERITAELKRIDADSDAPRGDTGWLLLRCKDTTEFSGEYQEASIRDLKWDIFLFNREFPGLLRSDLVPPEGSWERPIR